MAYGPIAQSTMETFTLQLKKLAAVGNSVDEETVQDEVVLHRAARLLSVKVVAGSVTSDPQVQIHKGVNPDTDGRLLNSMIAVSAADTVYSGDVNGYVRDLDAETKLTLRVETDAGDNISLINVVMEFLPLGEVRTLSQSEVQAEIDMSTVNAQMDNVIQAVKFGADGNNIRIKTIGDSPGAGGVTIGVTGDDVTIHFESGVSTQGDVNTAITALTGTTDKIIKVKTAGTTATVLVNGRAIIDMDTACTDADSIIQAGFGTGVLGNAYSYVTVPDGTGAGTLEVVTLAGGEKQLVYHFENAVSLVSDFETALAALSPADFELNTAGTGANAFDNPGDAATDMLASGTATNAENDFANMSGGADAVQ